MVKKMDKARTYPCAECEKSTLSFGPIAPMEWVRRGDRGYDTPDELTGWRCRSCGEIRIGPRERAIIDRHVDALIAQDEADQLRGFVETIKRTTQLDQRGIAEACGIHYTYLSKIINGRRPAGAPLAKLLEVFAAHPEVLRAQTAASSAAE